MKFLLYVAAIIGLASGACFDNGDKEIQGMCFKLVPQMLTYQDARDWCHYKNPVTSSNLAYVPNQFTANFLASYARSAFGSNDGYFWIGLSRTSSNSPFTWDNGQPLGYTNFGTQLGQNYIAESIVNTKWNAFGASDKNFFVCSYDPAAPPTFSPLPTRMPETTMMPMPTTTGNWDTTNTPSPGSCSSPFNGKIATVFELNGVQPEIENVIDFVSNNLYNSTNYDFSTVTETINIPYAHTDYYGSYLLQYGGAKSLMALQSNIDTLFSNSIFSIDTTVSDGLIWLSDNYPDGANTIVIVVGYHSDDDNGRTYTTLTHLRSRGYKVISVAAGVGHGDLSYIADESEWYFQVDNSTGGQNVADQISSIICKL